MMMIEQNKTEGAAWSMLHAKPRTHMAIHGPCGHFPSARDHVDISLAALLELLMANIAQR
jgi:hypothetical protein